MNYVELSFTVTPKEVGSDILISELSELGFDTFEDSEEGFSAYTPQEKYLKDQVGQVLKNYNDTFSISYSENIIEQQNWNALWESNFQPIEVDGACYIHAPFHEEKSGYKYNIVIEPKMSFGTGHHDTTQLMIKKLMSLDVKNKSILDMGCGTGVLAILASKMGASKVLAVDIDEWSYENTLENIKTNSSENIEVLKGDSSLLLDHSFNAVLANINKNVLLADIALYADILEKEGDLLLSGFFETDATELIEKAEVFGLTFCDKLINSSWALLHFTKN